MAETSPDTIDQATVNGLQLTVGCLPNWLSCSCRSCLGLALRAPPPLPPAWLPCSGGWVEEGSLGLLPRIPGPLLDVLAAICHPQPQVRESPARGPQKERGNWIGLPLDLDELPNGGPPPAHLFRLSRRPVPGDSRRSRRRSRRSRRFPAARFGVPGVSRRFLGVSRRPVPATRFRAIPGAASRRAPGALKCETVFKTDCFPTFPGVRFLRFPARRFYASRRAVSTLPGACGGSHAPTPISGT